MPDIEIRQLVHRSDSWSDGTPRTLLVERPLCSLTFLGRIPEHSSAVRINGAWFIPAGALTNHLEAEWHRAATSGRS